MANTIECVVCEKEIPLLEEYNGEPMCDECYHAPENEVFD